MHNTYLLNQHSLKFGQLLDNFVLSHFGKQKSLDFQTGSHYLYYIQGSLYSTNLASHFLTTYATTSGTPS